MLAQCAFVDVKSALTPPLSVEWPGKVAVKRGGSMFTITCRQSIRNGLNFSVVSGSKGFSKPPIDCKLSGMNASSNSRILLSCD
jgi:hypothetical protein